MRPILTCPAEQLDALRAAFEQAPGRVVEPEKLFFFTAASKRAAHHLRTSLVEGVALETLAPLTDLQEALRRHARDGKVFAWGARRGSAAEQKWKRLNPGDVGLVYADGHFPLWGRVYAKARSPEVARAFWGEDDGVSWDCMFFLEPVEQLGASRMEVVTEFGYQGSYVPQGFESPGAAAQERVREKHPALSQFVRALRRGEIREGTDRQRRCWWVCQGRSYAQEREAGILWTPKRGKAAPAGRFGRRCPDTRAYVARILGLMHGAGEPVTGGPGAGLIVRLVE